MAIVIHYIAYALGRLLYPIRGHDSRQIINSPAFVDLPEESIILEASECGHSGSSLEPQHTCLAEDGRGRLPELSWKTPSDIEVKEYIVTCEDLDAPIPLYIITHGLFFGIPATVTKIFHDDIEHDKDSAGRRTLSGWGYIPNMLGTPYIGAAAPLGHGAHRYVFTVIALNESLHFDHPERVSKSQIKEAIVGKVTGWGQWIGTFERPWPHK
ncbi:hypothetical protein P175DRAFT_0502128 [Aspergillus ochraceoroseus IBT 24754]|uniref:PEBP-like protein n=2 Tax=Aspergillus ochraceoroseus TaxID=138278 RepID=A0A2T5LUL4_9EURO|nr:uncharacterized protein P175DRAFT_0502128 [Aspergillus ochraceoroseus IBT 24754]KKK17692.1 hypothetical protein AOCH_000942 [Aspergillus ochraceoroseus]PTU19982.1 hypothetical protein P175DRAFT_0502128 [Aspergillus ochraceoroseus IBT 24754]